MNIYRWQRSLTGGVYGKALVCFILFLMPFSVLSCTASQTVQEAADQQLISGSEEDLSEQVTIRRTEYGIPHILAENMRAAGYALGYVQMEDDSQRVMERMVRARGEWAKYNDIAASSMEYRIDSDAANRQDYARAVETYHQLKKDTRDILEGFAAGVNRYIKKYPGEFPGWLKPEFTGYDVHAQGISTPSRSTIRQFLSEMEERKENGDDTEASFAQETSGLFYTDDSNIWARLSADAEELHPDAGSNAWAFSPDRTTSGNAILVRNPHLSWSAGYYEAHVEIPGVMNFYGDFRHGGPLGIIGGFNERLGWATTNNYPSLDEFYAFKADPENPDHILLDGASIPLEHETVTVEFKNGESLGRETREFWNTPFGPVIHRAGGKVYIIKSAGDGEFRTGEQFLEMMKSQNLDEWKTAMKMRAKSSSNLTYADAEGNIFYVWNASAPDLPHVSGGDSLATLVTKTDQLWLNPVEWEMLPQLENPEGGYLRNENDPFHFTNLNAVFNEDDFPVNYPDPQLRLRSQHSLELIHNAEKYSLEDVVELKHSMRMTLADRVKDDLVTAVRSTNPSGETAEAIDHIEQWDNTVARDSRGGILFKTWWSRYVSEADKKRVSSSPESAGFSATPEKLFAEVWSPERAAETPYGLADPDRAIDAFEWAIDEAKDEYGDWDLAWGEVHRAVIGDKDIAVGGCSGMLGCFRVLWFVDHEEDDKKLQVRGGDGWVLAVEFGEVPRAYSILAYGQSVNEDSPFFNDQLEMFGNDEMKRVAFTEEEIREQLLYEYRPGQERH